MSRIAIRSGGEGASIRSAQPADRPPARRRFVFALALAFVASIGLSCASSSDLGFETAESLDPQLVGVHQRVERTDFGIRIQVEQLSGMIVYDIECERWNSDYHLTPRRHSGPGPRRTLFDVHLPAEAPRDARFFWVTRRGWLPVWARDSATPSERVEVALTPDVVFDEEDTTRVRVDCI